MPSLTGRVAVVIGASGAIGAAISRRLHAEGATVALLARDIVRLNQIGDAIDPDRNHKESRIFVRSVDMLDESQLQATRDAVLAAFGQVDILVTAAAAPAASGRFEESTLEQWRAMLSIDLDGVYLANRIFGAPMIRRRYGRIVNLTSFHNVATYPYRALYNAAKSGVEGLSRALAVEWGHLGVTVNTVAPGPILTPRTEWFLAQDARNRSGMMGRTPTQRLGEVDEVAGLTAFLASEDARHINGQQIVIDGGWTKNAWWGSHSELS